MNRRALGFLASIVLAAAPVMAGPPLLCFPYEIGSAQSLPWGKDAFEQKKGYDKSKLVEDTLALLKTEKSTLVRMETLRRAAVYIGKEKTLGVDLLSKLSWIAMDAEAAGKPSAQSWFDAGYLAATLRQNGCDIAWHAGTAAGADGYAYIKKGLDLTPGDSAMQLGAAMVAHGNDERAFKEHLKQAIVGAPAGSDLARSIENNWACGHKPIGELCKEYGVAQKAAK